MASLDSPLERRRLAAVSGDEHRRLNFAGIPALMQLQVTLRKAHERPPFAGAAMSDVASPELSISSEKVCYIIAKAREFDAKDAPTVGDEASNPSDDRMVEVLEDRPGEDAVLDELRSLIADMSEDEQIDLVALAWLGRGDAGVEGWPDLRNEAARAHNQRTATYLLGIPLLPTYLENALAELGLSCEDFDRDNL